jgi:hypothetical protein
LAQDYSDFNYKDNFARTLDDLTVFELTLLHKLYTTDTKEENVNEEIINYFSSKNVESGLVEQGLKRLSLT